jgi:hypothetical protein
MSGPWDYLMVFLIAVNVVAMAAQASWYALGLTSGRWFAFWMLWSSGSIACLVYSMTHN